MSLYENLKSALTNVLSNKMRTILTMLGIIIGIASVIAITSVGNGSQQQITEQFDSLGVGKITVSLRNNSPRNINTGDALTLDDYELLKNLNGVKYISPVYTASYFSVKLNNPKETNTASITGATSEYINISSPTILYGRYISDNDVENKSTVVLITDTTANKIFGYCNNSIVGQKISIKSWKGSKKYTVIGIIEDTQTSSSVDNEYPEEITMPITTAQRLFGQKSLTNISLIAQEPDNSAILCERLVAALDKEHNTSEKYTAVSTSEQLEAMNSVTGTVTLLISGVAAISLLVGGIGVMNIMMVTVTERTREIGIRKSIGAKNRDIMLQFVTEAIFLTVMGGILGILCGRLLGIAAGHFMSVTSVVSIKSIIFAVSISCGIGIVFGVYPARKAAMLDPIEALRYE